MTTNEIRKKFLDFFASKGHTIVESDSLVPKDDPTVLFTTAGMQQFKRQFLGHIEGYTRAASSQKCLRTDDLEEVGQTDFHHTFFEMLGNFSFGDYFKKEAIEWGWEFLTQDLKIPEEKLWVSVYKDDQEAEAIWLKDIGIDKRKLVKLGDHSNFWPADAKEKGPNGPCGPCSEIFYDYGGEGLKSNPGNDKKGRFSEVWNLVFTQYDRKDGGILEPLPNKNIDTGMGLERLAAVLQGKKCNYDIDLFEPILQAIDNQISFKKLSKRNERYVLADHIRAICFGINDGVVPSNEGRGYVIKKLIIDITDIALTNGVAKPVIHTLVASVAQAMGEAYPEISKKEKDIAAIIKRVEESYIRVRKERLPELEKKIKESKDQPNKDRIKILGQLIFTYRDTYGLTIPTIMSILEKSDIEDKDRTAIEKEYQMHMQDQQSRSRDASKMTGDVFTGTSLSLGVPKTEFTGYDHSQSSSTILGLLVNGKKVNEINENDEAIIILDKTCFYAEAGGQIGDIGIMIKDKHCVRILDTQKQDDVYIHSGIVERGQFKVKDLVMAEIDTNRRMSIMRNHTATHLLQAALRDILGSHVKQQGSFVAEDRLRFDFTHHTAITYEQLKAIEHHVNEMILASETVTKEYLDITEAKNSGALQFFAEKYGKIVRVVTIGEVSKEFCGGTHLDSTGQIGLFKIISEGAIAQGIRRLEAKTGMGALEYISQQNDQLEELSQIMKVPGNEIVNRIKKQSQRIKDLQKELDNLRLENIKNSIDAILKASDSLNGTKLVSHSFKKMEMDILKKVSELIKQKAKSTVILLGSQSEENSSLLVAVSDDLIKKGLKANEIIKDIAPLIEGKGGGRPQMAQAGSKKSVKIENVIKEANLLIKKKLK